MEEGTHDFPFGLRVCLAIIGESFSQVGFRGCVGFASSGVTPKEFTEPQVVLPTRTAKLHDVRMMRADRRHGLPHEDMTAARSRVAPIVVPNSLEGSDSRQSVREHKANRDVENRFCWEVRYRRTTDMFDGVLEASKFEQKEQVALDVANEMVRGCLEADLREREARFEEEVVVNGRLYRRHEPGTVVYHSLCGSLGVERWTYREVGLRNGPTLVPLELDAGLVESATPALGYSLTLGYSKGPLRSYREDMEAAGREVPSRSTLERIAKDIGTAGREATPRIEPVLRRSEGIPSGAWSVTLGLDR